MSTQAAILGAGPAGLLLGRMLQSGGIDTVVLEQRSRDYVPARVRAGVLEPGTVKTLKEFGVNKRMDELDVRLADQYGNVLNRGPITDRCVARLRGFVCEKLRYGRLALAGDASHIVPPSGAKGLNLAVGDVRILYQAIVRLLQENDNRLLDDYTELALKRIWPTVHWSCRMSEMFHMFPGQTDFDTRRQYQTLSYWSHDDDGQRFFRNSMLGLPFAM